MNKVAFTFLLYSYSEQIFSHKTLITIFPWKSIYISIYIKYIFIFDKLAFFDGKKCFVQKFPTSFSKLRPASVLYKHEAFTLGAFVDLRRGHKRNVGWAGKICVCKVVGTSQGIWRVKYKKLLMTVFQLILKLS